MGQGQSRQEMTMMEDGVDDGIGRLLYALVPAARPLVRHNAAPPAGFSFPSVDVSTYDYPSPQWLVPMAQPTIALILGSVSERRMGSLYRTRWKHEGTGRRKGVQNRGEGKSRNLGRRDNALRGREGDREICGRTRAIEKDGERESGTRGNRVLAGGEEQGKGDPKGREELSGRKKKRLGSFAPYEAKRVFWP